MATEVQVSTRYKSKHSFVVSISLEDKNKTRGGDESSKFALEKTFSFFRFDLLSCQLNYLKISKSPIFSNTINS